MKKILLSIILTLISSSWTRMAALCMPSLAPAADASITISGTLRYVSYPCEGDEPCPDCLTLGLMTEDLFYYVTAADENITAQLEELEMLLWEQNNLPVTVSGIPYTQGNTPYISVTDIALVAKEDGIVFEFTSWDAIMQEIDGYTVTLDQGTGSNYPYFDEYIASGPEMRIYTGNTITITGEGLQNIQFVFACPDGKQYATMSASVGTLVSGGTSTGRDNPILDTWTGETGEVVFTLAGQYGQRVIRKVVVNGGTVDPEDQDPPVDPEPLPLEPEYNYPEPTVVHVPDRVISHQQYTIVDNNIMVHCTQGSIIRESTDPEDPHPAYFNCNAGYEISFMASQPIKGLAIDGLVKKEFVATCDFGNLEYRSEDYELEDYPVLVIQDVDATMVTLTCPKQIRCYEVRVYFESNPAGLDEETGVEQVDSGKWKIESRKILYDGHLYLMYKGKMYDVQGAEVK